MPYDSTIYDYLPYQERNPYESELNWFYQNPNVGGMKTEDSRIILNPYSNLNDLEKRQVRRNEALRLYLDSLNYTPYFPITEQQRSYFSNTPYRNNLSQMRNTLVARILTNDPSAQDVTDRQQKYANFLYNSILNRFGR